MLSVKSSRTLRVSLTAGVVISSFIVLALAGCNAGADGASSSGAGSGDRGTTTEWSMDSDCTACHRAVSPDGAGTGTLSALHAGEDVGCATCHTDEAGLSKVHEGVTSDSKMPARLKATKIDTQTVCLSCHKQQDLVSATAGSTVLTDADGKTVNPHDLPAKGTHRSDITCTDCHIVHAQTADMGKNAMAKCVSCHHKQVFACGTCHSV